MVNLRLVNCADKNIGSRHMSARALRTLGGVELPKFVRFMVREILQKG